MFRSGKTPDTWVGMDAYLSVVCFNTAEAEKGKKGEAGELGRSHQARVQGLDRDAEPGLVGHRLSRRSSAWLQIMGEEAGWKFMDALHQNIAQYIHSGSAPCVQAAKGERADRHRPRHARRLGEDQGRAARLILPKEGLGWELEVTAIVKGTKNLEAAKKLADWAVSKKANESTSRPIRRRLSGRRATPPNYPADIEKAMIKNDIEWMAKNRDRILAEWTKRYDGSRRRRAK